MARSAEKPAQVSRHRPSAPPAMRDFGASQRQSGRAAWPSAIADELACGHDGGPRTAGTERPRRQIGHGGRLVRYQHPGRGGLGARIRQQGAQVVLGIGRAAGADAKKTAAVASSPGSGRRR